MSTGEEQGKDELTLFQPMTAFAVMVSHTPISVYNHNRRTSRSVLLFTSTGQGLGYLSFSVGDPDTPLLPAASLKDEGCSPQLSVKQTHSVERRR